VVVCSRHKNNKCQNVWGFQLQNFFLKFGKKTQKCQLTRLVVLRLKNGWFKCLAMITGADLPLQHAEPSQWLQDIFWHWILPSCGWIDFRLRFLPLVSLGLSHVWFLFHFNIKKIFNRSVWFLICALYSALHLQMQVIDRSK